MRDVLVQLRSASAVSSDTQGRYYFQFSNPLVANFDESIHVSVHAAAIPHSFYNVRADNNKFTFIETIGSQSSTSRTITLPPGSYTVSSLSTMLSSLLITNNVTYTVTFDNVTGKFSISSTEPTLVSFGMELTSGSPHVVLGFVNNTTVYSTSSNNIKTLTPPNVGDLTGARHSVYVQSSLVSTSLVGSNLTVDNSAIAVIPITCNPFQMILFDNTHRFKLRLQQQYISTFFIQLCDAVGNHLEFNGVDWEMQLHFAFEYNNDQKVSRQMGQLLAVNRDLLNVSLKQYLDNQAIQKERIRKEIGELQENLLTSQSNN